MVSIPKIIAGGNIDIGGGTVPRFDTSGAPFGQLRQFGNVLAQQGQVIQQERDNQFLVDAQTNSSTTWNDQYFERTQSAPADGAQFTKNMMVDFDKWRDQQLDAAPNVETKQKLNNSLANLRGNLQDKSARFERERLKQTTLGNLDKMQQANVKLVYDNPLQHDFYLDQGFDAIEISNITEPEKAARKEILKSQLDQARAQRDVDTDPNGAFKRLGGTKRAIAPPRLSKSINRASSATGGRISANYLTVLAGKESSFGKNTVAETSSARGTYQFTKGTWLDTFGKYGSAFGFDPKSMTKNEILALRDNEDLSTNMAAIFAGNNKSFVEKSLGRSITDGELAIAHFMGRGGGAKFLGIFERNPNANAAAAFPESAAANKSIFFHKNGSPKTIQQVYNERVKPYDGAGSGGQVSGVYKDLSLNDRLKFQKLAGASVNNLNRQQAQQQSTQYSQFKHDLGVRIQDNTATVADVDQAYDNNQLSNNDHISLRKQAITAQGQLVKDADFAGDAETILKGGNAPINPADKDAVKTYDNYVQAVDSTGKSLNGKIAEGDTQAATHAAELARGTGLISKSTVGAIKSSINGGTDQQRDAAYQTISIMNDKAPQAVATTPSMSGIAKDAKTYQALLNKGFSSTDALARLDEMKSPEFQRLEDIRGKKARELANDITQDQVSEALAPTFFLGLGGGATFGGDQNVADTAVQDYKDAFKFHYNATGDEDVANELTKQEMNRTWGVSEATGNNVSMLRPPENFYPPVAGYEGGAHKYIEDQLNEDVAAAAKESGHEVENIIIQSSIQTLEDVSGRSFGQHSTGGLGEVDTVTRMQEPRYTVGYTTTIDGIPQVITLPLLWKADPQLAKDIVQTDTAIVAHETNAEAKETNLLIEGERKLGEEFSFKHIPISERIKNEQDIQAKVEAIDADTEEKVTKLKAKARQLKGQPPLEEAEDLGEEPTPAEVDTTSQEEINLGNEEIRRLQDEIESLNDRDFPSDKIKIRLLKEEISFIKDAIVDLKKGEK